MQLKQKKSNCQKNKCSFHQYAAMPWPLPETIIFVLDNSLYTRLRQFTAPLTSSSTYSALVFTPPTCTQFPSSKAHFTGDSPPFPSSLCAFKFTSLRLTSHLTSSFGSFALPTSLRYTSFYRVQVVCLYSVSRFLHRLPVLVLSMIFPLRFVYSYLSALSKERFC